MVTSTKKKDGGVFIAVKNCWEAEELPVSNVELEQLFVKIKYGRDIIIVDCVYFIPGTSWELYNKHFLELNLIISKYNKCKTIILGDYNLPSVSDEYLENTNKIDNRRIYE